MEKSFVVRPLDPWWRERGKCMVLVNQQTIKDLGWKFGEAVEITIKDGKIIIEKLNKEDNNGEKV